MMAATPEGKIAGEGDATATTNDHNTNTSGTDKAAENVPPDTHITTPAPSPLSRLLALLPPSLKHPRTLKTFARCLLASICCLVLLLDQRTLDRMGQAGFFAAILSIMLPPSMAISMFILAGLTLVIGMCLGWAWGCAAMAAALQARSQILLASEYETAEAGLLPGINPDAQFELLIFQAAFVDPRSSIVFAIFFFLGTFFLGLLRAYVPRLALTAIFGTIVLDIMCSYGPLFPSAQYTLATMFLIPTGFYLAIAVGSLIFIFPETMNHIWITTLTETVLTPSISLLALHTRALLLPPSTLSTPADWAALRDESHELARGLVAASRGVKGQAGMAELEVSRGRLGPGDLKRVGGRVEEVAARQLGLLSLIEIVDDVYTTDSATQSALPSAPASGGVSPSATAGAARYARMRQTVREREARHGHSLDELRPVLEEATREVREACTEGLEGVKGWLDEVNSNRWTLRQPNPKDEHTKLELARAQLAHIRSSLATFRTTRRLALIAPFERFFDASTGELLPHITRRAEAGSRENMFAAQSLFLCFTVGAGWKAYAESLGRWLEEVLEVRAKRTTNQFWAPMGLWKIADKIRERNVVDLGIGEGLGMGVSEGVEREVEEETAVDEEEEEEEEEEVGGADEEKGKGKNGKKGKKGKKGTDDGLEPFPKPSPLDPDSTPSRTSFGKIQARIAKFVRWWGTAQALYALRYGIVSVALYAIAVAPTTAYFFYTNRGIWALIMAQLGLGIYAGEQIANFLLRITSTVLGLVLGMVAWYIGAGGLGPGNGYGIVVITAVVLAPFLFVRVATPGATPSGTMAFWLMSGVMIVFVVGYSWIDGHITVLADPGVGVDVAWRRAVTVVVGFAAAFVVMLFPSPTSARQVVRKTLARTTEDILDIFSAEVDTVVSEAHEALPASGSGKAWAKKKDLRLRRLGKRLLALSEALHGIEPSMTTAKFEPTFKGPWPAATYRRLMSAQWRLIHYIALLNGALFELNQEWLHVLVHLTPFLNPNLLSDIGATVYIVARALRHAYPVPSSLTPIKERLIYHERHSAAYGGVFGDDPVALEEELGANPDRVDGATIGLRSLTLDVLKDEQLVFHSTAVMALSGIYRTVDEITDITRELCGTTASYGGFDLMRSEYLGMEEAAIRRKAERAE